MDLENNLPMSFQIISYQIEQKFLLSKVERIGAQTKAKNVAQQK